ncbi:hypothetical protein [Solirubrum puertoriconensis]|uniref:Uncharacterized protein n=1 Tax=Solirubrum puertoriconensis TaxID=1751427 RepID=A0A9X0HJG6_SOLP1|nr:hypothetical protein [Solirubrum puertoriconensis]KUG06991.1 hypothetical protein ASU33_06630 [Solirubrum puertoriconensis]
MINHPIHPASDSHVGLPPARPADPLRSPRPRRSQQPGQAEPETAPERTQPASPGFKMSRWC